VRAAATAEAIAREVAVEVRHVDGLMECDNGVLAGLPRAEARQRYPLPPGGRRPHECVSGGETELAFRARVEHLYSEIRHLDPPPSRIALVTHGGTITMLFRAFLELPMVADVWLSTSDTGVHRWLLEGRRRRVLCANDTAHLSDSMAAP
jgi:2,3-bisphosphoglycerate-dependent phosphoglycerate mutase